MRRIVTQVTVRGFVDADREIVCDALIETWFAIGFSACRTSI